MQQGLQVPRDLGATFRVAASSLGPGGVKILGTAAVALVLGLPDAVRERLCRAVVEHSWGPSDPNVITPELAWDTVAAEIARLADDNQPRDGEDAERYILRLVGDLGSKWGGGPKKAG
jgi:hypothetical protein